MKVVFACIGIFLVAGCATSTPIFKSEDGPAAPSTLSLHVLEVRPNAILLEVQSSEVAFTHIEVFKVFEDQEPQNILTLNIDASLNQKLSEGLTLRDPNNAAGRYAYALLMKNGEERVGSAELAFELGPQPLKPRVVASAEADFVRVNWQVEKESSAIVFRRNVLAGTPFERVAELNVPTSEWVDTAVEPDGVYAYRVSLVTLGSTSQNDLFALMGEPSEEVYASVPSRDAAASSNGPQ
jgi:hypothetical protein